MTRTRFAPSPTGYLHIGAIRTVLYCFALAKKEEGKFILRLEDTDRKRFIEDAEEKIYKTLDAYGLVPDESPIHGGEFGPYKQSERLELYQKYADELTQKDLAYYCFLTPEETAELQESAKAQSIAVRSPYRDMKRNDAIERIEKGDKFVIRLKVPEDRELIYKDGVQGDMKFNTSDVSDQVLIKQDGYPTYHMAVVVDDHLMKISHVFRGFEFIPSIPKQMLLYEGLGWKMPEHYHLSVILNSNGQGKLSKRDGSVAAADFLNEGFLPEAVLNFLMLLGWSSPEERTHGEKERELFSLDEFIALFDPKDLNKSNPKFDREKLVWFNSQYIAKQDPKELTAEFIRWLETVDIEKLKNGEDDSSQFEETKEKILSDTKLAEKLTLVQERSKNLKEIFHGIKFFYEAPEEIDWEIKQLKKIQNSKLKIQNAIIDLIESLDDDASKWTHEEWENGMRKIGDENEAKHGDVFMVLRVAVVGSPFSPPLFESLQILGKEEVLRRLNKK